MDTEKIGKFIKDIRKKNNLTQKDLAEKLNVTYQAVSKWENGKSIPDIEVLKLISEEFNTSIDEVINGEYKNINKKKKSKIIIGIILIIIVLILLVILLITLKPDNDFEFNPIYTSCKEFTITGSVAYNREKTSIYISNVEFCGEGNKDIKYEKINCKLYETYEDTDKLISSCGEDNNKTLTEFLEKIRINVDNYITMCKTFASSSVYLEINAYNSDEEFTTYKIPIELDDNCSK